jgi:hypothetical protein
MKNDTSVDGVTAGRLGQYPLYHCARVAVMGDLPSKTYYTAQRQRGHTHGRALRAVADRLLRSWSPRSRLEPSSIAQRHDRGRSVTFQRKLHDPLDRGWGVLALPCQKPKPRFPLPLQLMHFHSGH